MKRMLAICMSTALFLTACSQRPVLKIAEQGSFAIGGKVLTDSLGHTYHGDHAYVFFQKPVAARKYPLVFAHGVGQFSKTWETTPDGREGFQTLMLRHGFGSYVVDLPGRGRAGRTTAETTLAPKADEQFWFDIFRIGHWPAFNPGVQFPTDTASLDQFFRQMTPDIGSHDTQTDLAALIAQHTAVNRNHGFLIAQQGADFVGKIV